MKFIYRVTRRGVRQIRAELWRDGNTYRSAWQTLPPTGLGIDERRAAWNEVTETAQAEARGKLEQVYRGKRS